MKKIRHEEYENMEHTKPFKLFANLERSRSNCSAEMNWHENLEIEICTKGKGAVLLDGKQYSFSQNDIAVINSNVIHYTGSETMLVYSALIINSRFFQNIGIDLNAICFEPIVRNAKITDLFLRFQKTYLDDNVRIKEAKQNDLLLRILIELAENHCTEIKDTTKPKSFESIKKTIDYIRNNYSKKISLDELAKNAAIDKYVLSREFKKFTGQTIVEYINSFRCQKASDYIISGYNISEAAQMCGFDNLSFFTKTFKRHMCILPSKIKENQCI